MKKLKIILQSNYFYYILFIISIIYTVLNINLVDSKSIFSLKTKNIYGYVNDYSVDGDKLTIILKTKEKVLVNYYFKSEKEKNNFEICYGDYIEVFGNISIPSENTNFNLFNYRKYLKTRKINYIMNASSINIKQKNNNIFYNIKNIIVRKIEDRKTSSYLKTFIIGDKRKIDGEIISSYQYLGISHLFAISGMHVTFLSMVILKILSKFNDKFKYLIISIFLVFYLFLTNYTISIIRSTFQFILFSINKLFSLELKNINLVLLLISILLIYNPYYIYDVGFLFSFSISFGLILVSDLIKNINNYIIKSITISAISFLVSLPILINNFYQVNFLSIIYNIFYIPLVSFILFPLNLLTLLFPFLDNINSLFISIFENITLLLNQIKIFSFSVAKIPIVLIIIYYIFLYLIYIKVKKKNRYKKYVIILIILIIIFINNNRFILVPEITFIDVGQGDCTLIRILDKSILIDTGGKISINKGIWQEKSREYNISDSIILPYLKSIGVKKIDYMILTHGDFDHMGEAKNIADNFNVKNIIINDYDTTNIEDELCTNYVCKKYRKNDKLTIYDNVFYFLNPDEDLNENENSLIILSNINNKNILLMGDASIKNEKRIINEYYIDKIDILKVGHHGSNTSTSEEFLKYIKPEYAVISVGKNNIYNHPSKMVLERLEKNRTKVFKTMNDGMIKIKLYGKTVKINTAISYN